MTSIKTFESKHQIPVRMTRIDNPGTGIIFLDKVRKSLSQQTHGGKNIHAVIRDWGLGTLLIFIFLENTRQLTFGFSQCHFHHPG